MTEINTTTSMDKLTQIWTLNSVVPEPFEQCLHDIIASNAARDPSKLAVHAWDGDLTYGELDALSTKLSYQLSDSGVGPEVTVPLLFEKSMWTVVAVVGVLKAGGSFALIDMALPTSRLQAIIERCRAKVVCASVSNAATCSKLAERVEVVGPNSHRQWPITASPAAASNKDINPSCPMYVCFTSGSTGQPKGIIITHRSFCTSFYHQAHLVGFDSECRTFDFASYSFDVAVHNVMTTLAIGGTLCIPSDTDRKTNLNQSIRDMRANIVNLTATVARLLQPQMLPDMKTLILLGEAVNLVDLEDLWGHLKIINTYGPAECTPISTINLTATTPASAVGIGIGYGVLTWVVDAEDHDKLVAYGEIGELLLEGHVLARGYLHDAEKTAAAFIENPSWLLQGTEDHLGRQGRLYKTGDLVRYDPDGSLQFMGRKDTQVKIRGQRLELGEVEYHVGKCVQPASQVVVEVIQIDGQRDKTMLAAFLTANKDIDTAFSDLYEIASEIAPGLHLLHLKSSVHQDVAQRLPVYMIPAVYFLIDTMPQTPSAKTDRKSLREIGMGLSAQGLADAQVGGGRAGTEEYRSPQTEAEHILQGVWADILSLSLTSIGLDSSFFLLGGDSVGAMRLVAETRKVGYQVSVADVFQHPRLVDLAKSLHAADTDSDGTSIQVAPFSVIARRQIGVVSEDDSTTSSGAGPQLLADLGTLCHNLNPALIQDAYPSTPLQQGLLSLTAQGNKGYILQAVLELSEDANLSIFKAAWEETVALLPILRARHVHHGTLGPLQVIIDESITWHESENLQEYLQKDKSIDMGLGDGLVRYALVENRYFVWTIHHALYDGWSLGLVLEAFSKSYKAHLEGSEQNTSISNDHADFAVFVKHLVQGQRDAAKAEAYWKSYFADGELTAYPVVPSNVSTPTSNSSMEHMVAVTSKSEITMSTLIRGAVSILLSQYTASSDVVFGATLSGRNAAVANIGQIVGPTIATVPIRSRVDRDLKVHDFLQQLQQHATNMIEYEQTGLQNIAKMSDDCRLACAFQTLLVVQPDGNDFNDNDTIGQWQTSTLREITTYALTLECKLGSDGVKIRAAYDSQVMSQMQVQYMLHHLDTILNQLAAATNDDRIQDIDTVTPTDCNTLWAWNADLPASIEKCVHDLILKESHNREHAQAVCGWDGSFTFGELNEMSAALAYHLIELGVGPDAVVPLCFDKSSYAIVAMLAVLRAGGAFLPLNPGEAEERRHDILNQTKATIALTSESQTHVSLIPGCTSFVVSHETLLALQNASKGASKASISLPKTNPSSSVYVIFTSGSTGQPKGVVLEHNAVSTSCSYHGLRFGFGRSTRMLQFSSYTFDASIIEILTTLIHGGCVCVPSETDRLGDLAKAMTDMSVNSTLLTPTVARTLQRASVPTLTTLIFGGEAVKQSDYDDWEGLPLIINAYGPTEGAVTSVIGRYDKATTKFGSIGTSVSCATWVVDQFNHDKLVPIGAVGELLLEGAILARGYLNNPEKTAAVFIEDPKWLLQGSANNNVPNGRQNGRQGRLYKTGDLVRYNDDGSISYVGRKDAQVKLRGQRLELGEVEYQVRNCINNMTQVIADVVELGGQQDKKMLAAFFTANESNTKNTWIANLVQLSPGVDMVRLHSDIESELSAKLPRYMVPSLFLRLDKIPLMPSGKTNRKILRQIASSISSEQLAKLNPRSGKTKQPENEIENNLRNIWARVLNVDSNNLGTEDSFFHVGGDSITAMQVSSAIRSSLGDVSTSDILRLKTISKIAALLGPASNLKSSPTTTKQQQTTAVSKQIVEQTFDLSPVQQLYTHLESDPRRCFDQFFFLRLGSKVHFSDLRNALRAVVSRHPMLRARYSMNDDGKWEQRITDDVSGSLHVCQTGNGPLSMSPTEIARLISHDRDLIDIENGPLTVAMLINNGVSQQFFIAIHHLVIDLVSWRILLQEIEELILFGNISMPPPNFEFQNWINLQQNYMAKSFGNENSSTSLLPTPPLTPPSAPMLTYWDMSMSDNVEGDTFTKSFVLDKLSTDALFGNCNNAFGTRPVELMISALTFAFINTFQDRESPSIYTEGHGREPWDDSIDISRTVGWFTTIYPVQATSARDSKLSDVIPRVKDAIRSLRKNGWENFTSKFATTRNTQSNIKEYPVEILFNYSGSYQQLERSDSLFQNAVPPKGCESSTWSELTRFSLFDVFCQTDKSCLSVSVTYPKASAHQEKIESWIELYKMTLQSLQDELQSHPRKFTLADFPNAFKTYQNLHTFSSSVLPELGLTNLDDIEDIFPCSAMQEGILVAQGKDPLNYRTVLSIDMEIDQDSGSIDISRISQAWRAVVQRHSLLRAILVDNFPGASGTMQIVLRAPEPSITVLNDDEWTLRKQTNLVNYAHNELQHHMFIHQIDSQRAQLDLEINHVMADGYSVYNILLQDIRIAYNNKLDIDGPLYSSFIEYVRSQSPEADLSFWMKQLDGIEPCFASASSKNSANEPHAFTIDLEPIDGAQIRKFTANCEVTTAIVIQVAWAIVLQMNTGQSAPSFGILTSGRDTPVKNVHDIFGPLINIVPCHIRLDEQSAIADIVQKVQDEYIESFPHQTLPLIDIHRKLGVGASGLFNSAISFQKSTDNGNKEATDGLHLTYRDVKDQVEFDVSVAVDDNYTVNGTGSINIQLLFKACYATHSQAQFLANAFSSTIEALVASNHLNSLSQMSLLRESDKMQLHTWNCDAALPSVDNCIHTLIEGQMESRPEAPAICSWDGNLSYQELDNLTAQLASYLSHNGVGPEVVVPLCFEKSMWTVVAWVAVLRSGGAFILLDPSLPAARIENICRLVKAEVAITSSTNFNRLSGFVKHTVTLDAQFVANLAQGNKNFEILSQPSPSNAAYIIFTSGSTGEPKGAVIEHRSYCTAALHHGPTMTMSPETRSLQFGSYNFAGAIMEMLMVLIHGGCICILSDEQRGPGQRLVKAINELNANWAFLTSTVLAYMSPEEVPSLRTVCVGGEAVRSSQILEWAGAVHLRQTYGSAETAAVVSSAFLDAKSANTHVGTPTTGRYWIVNPRNSDQLMPVGVPGEILIEGAVIGREYMSNPEKTAIAFIPAPKWRQSFGPQTPTARFYRTGDLGCFKEDGSLELLGRKDTQVKLRGQRIEVGEIEYQAREATSQVREAAVELSTIGSSSSTGAELVGFLVIDDHENAATASSIIRTVQAKLESVLPYFMVPSLLVPIAKLPLTASGKTDRRRLRIAATELSTEQLEQLAKLARAETCAPRNSAETQMRALWAEVLNVEETNISIEDSFFRLGGDSVAAMKLVGAARKVGIAMTVADIFRQPCLASQARDLISTTTSSTTSDSSKTIPPFSLLNVTSEAVDPLCEELASLCGDSLHEGMIQDAYPCTSLQQGFLSSTLRGNGGDYILQIVLEFVEGVEVGALKAAWDIVVDSTAILRTRIVQHAQFGLIQVVCNERINWVEANQDLERYLKDDRETPMELGGRLLRLGTVSNKQKTWMVCTVHHALYDGLSLPFILEMVQSAYLGNTVEELTPYNAFISHITTIDKTESEEYWQTYLSGGQFTTFPSLPPSIQEPSPDCFLEREISLEDNMSSFTMSTLVRGALAMVISQHTGSGDVVFGTLVSGRNAPVFGIEEIVGPTIATVPVRVQVQRAQEIHTYLETIQQQSTEMFAYEQTGLQKISKINENAKTACNFQTLLEIQPFGDDLFEFAGKAAWQLVSDPTGFTNYALTIDCILHKDKIVLKASIDTAVLDQSFTSNMLAQFDVAIQSLMTGSAGQKVGDIDIITEEERATLWQWNASAIEVERDTLQDIISQRVLESPNAPAVCAWDGELTYQQLGQLSTKLGQHLSQLGVGPETVVPLFFEKSMWTVVTVMGVLKAGGAFALLDMGLPEGRLHAVIEQCGARIVCSSEKNKRLCSVESTNVQIVGPDTVHTWPQNITDFKPSQYQSTSPMYVCFTSGSTGKPKGIVITHGSFATALKHQASLLGFNSDSRVFDFASYSFDVAVHNVMTTLAVGACLCIPSDSDRKNNINGAIHAMRANMVDLTATVARLLRPDMLPHLQTLILLGENVNATDLDELWGKGDISIINTYGPAECTPISTINLTAKTPMEATKIGIGFGVVTWVVDPEDDSKLLPPGVVGELLLEGPTLARGYLGDPEKTAQAFIENPNWLRQAPSGFEGRQGRLYKTGDLVKYNKDGSMSFVGRKDTQVKIRGQRLELGEIEHHVRECVFNPGQTQVVADVIMPGGEKDKAMLAVFIVHDDDSDAMSTNGSTNGSTSGGSSSENYSYSGHSSSNTSILFDSISSVSDTLELVTLNADIGMELSRRLPSYMTPSIYLRVPAFPQTPSGKTDRKRLREIGSSMSTEQLASMRAACSNCNQEKRQPNTKESQQLQKLWARVLHLDVDSIGLDDHFFLLGGDSVAAIQLVAEARKAGVPLTVSEVFQAPSLEAQAKLMMATDSFELTATIVSPFALLGNASSPSSHAQQVETRHDLAVLCNVEDELIQDAYPCSALQEGLISLTAKDNKNYILQAVLELPPHVQLNAVKIAWEQVVQSTPILRTRIVQPEDIGLVQVVTNEGVDWIQASSMEDYLKQDASLPPMGLGEPLCRLALIQDTKINTDKVVWTIHHALYDGASLPLLMEAVTNAYLTCIAGDQAVESSSPAFNTFVNYIVSQNGEDATTYWQNYFSDTEVVPFPLQTPKATRIPKVLEHNLTVDSTNKSAITMSSVLRGALAILMSQQTASKDIVFGAVVSGRSARVADIDNIIGPTIAAVPIRVQLQAGQSIKTYLETIQQQATQMIDFEQTGLQRIATVSEDARKACDFQTLLVVQPEEADLNQDEDVLGSWHLLSQTGAFTSYSLMLECLLGGGGSRIKLRASYDANVISEVGMSTMLNQLSHIIHNLTSMSIEKGIEAIQTIPQQDESAIWEWNTNLPVIKEESVQQLFETHVLACPDSPAICGFDGSYTYAELNDLATKLACHIAKVGAQPGSMIPICFEKSSLTIITMLAINKAGCAFVPLNPADGSDRHTYLLRETRASIVATSATAHERIGSTITAAGCTSIVVDNALLDKLSTKHTNADVSQLLHIANLDSVMYVLFTSGSTGNPKGVILKNQSVATSCWHHGQRFGFNHTSRVLQFSSYTFDACISEIFGTLIFGGCICVPSESDRLSNLEGAISNMGVNTAMITPTVSHMLDPTAVASMHTLILCGEPASESDYQNWLGLPILINGYGPTECSVYAVTATYDQVKSHPGAIGKGVGCATWVVDPLDHEKLTPIGGVGELLLEGWTVAEGYLNDSEKTAASFIKSPSWLVRGCETHSGRQGRVYKTGDLVRYNDDGTLSFIARRDNQVKIRGQRLELGEVEHHVRTCLPSAHQVAAEVIMPENNKQKATLAIFLTAADDVDGALDLSFSKEQIQVGGDSQLVHVHVSPEAGGRLAQRLPPYMIPSIYFKVHHLPISAAGKVDRKRLRQVGSGLSAQQIVDMQAHSAEEKVQPETEQEEELQRLWARVLSIEKESISVTDSFFRLGGDSIAAMRLVGIARSCDIMLTVGDIFKFPILRLQAELISNVTEEDEEEIRPFSIGSIGGALEVSHLINMDHSYIQDAYPCTPLQEGLLSLTARRSGNYTLQAVLELADSVDINHFKSAWDQVIQQTAILRTRIAQHDDLGLIQVVHNQLPEWRQASDLTTYLENDRMLPMEIGSDLSRLALVSTNKIGHDNRHFVWTVHHALYDGWMMSRVLNLVSQAYMDEQLILENTPSFNTFVKYTFGQRQDSSAYWQNYLEGGNMAVFPTVSPAFKGESVADSVLEKSMEIQLNNNSGITMATIIRGALSLLISQYTGGANDVVFGATVSGRSAPIAGITDILGPTIATVPIRVQLGAEQLVEDYLSQIQQQAADMEHKAYEQIGLQNISKLNDDCRSACGFQTLLVVQPQENDFDDEYSLGTWKSSSSSDTSTFSTYPLTLECFMESSGIKVRASFDQAIIPVWQMELVLERFRQLLQALAMVNPKQNLRDLDLLTEEESSIIWAWNKQVPEALELPLDRLISYQVLSNSEAPAICSWDGQLSYQELDNLSSRLAAHLISLGIGSESIVPLCFERSIWMVVSMLAVMKAGGAFVAINYSDAPERQALILQETKSNLVLTSATCNDIVLPADCVKVIVSKKALSYLRMESAVAKSHSNPQSAIYLIFTSGSTGKPKGVVLEHQAVSTSCRAHGARYGFNEKTRILQFSSYTFDACIVEIFTTLIFGGCICVPSESDRLGNLTGVINSMDVNLLHTTPTVTRTLQPEEVPTLQSLILCGEPVSQSDYAQWKDMPRIMNGYGPTEAAICSTIDIYDANNPQLDCIGTAVGCVTWIADQDDENKLCPIGAIGELFIEGHVLARGYLNDESKTTAAFIQNPTWLNAGCNSQQGRSGRLYKTGDLVKYNKDGSLSYIGRKDTQAKIRGQRLELGEVEHHLRKNIPCPAQIVAEVITPNNIKEKAMLAVFATFDDAELVQSGNSHTIEGSLRVFTIHPTVGTALLQRLPSYMVPTIYFHMDSIPLMPSGKTNRKYLRELGSSLTPQQLADAMAALMQSSGKSKRQPQTDSELSLRRLWSQVLKVDEESIGLEDNFFRLGGDSITAMRLVALARREDLALSIANIFQRPLLEEQAMGIAETLSNPPTMAPSVMPFELIQHSAKDSIIEVASALVAPFKIDDIYPATTFQEQTVKHSIASPKQGYNYFYFDLGANIDEQHLADSCNAVLESFASLRLTFVFTQGQCWQVVLNAIKLCLPTIRVTEDLPRAFSHLCAQDNEAGFQLENLLTSFMLIHHKSQGYRLVLRLSHAQYDGVSFPIMVKALFDHYQSKSMDSVLDFSTYLKYIASKETDSLRYWSDLLRGAELSSLASLASSADLNTSPRKVLIEDSVSFSTTIPENATLASITSSAWAVVLSALTGRNDVVYGNLVTGRNSNFLGIDQVAGPCNNVLPVRAQLDRHATATKLISGMQQQQLLVGEADSLGMTEIAHNCTSWPHTSQLDSIVKHQGIDENYQFDLGGTSVTAGYFDNPCDVPASYLGVFTYPLKDGVKVQVISNSHIISHDKAVLVHSAICETIKTLVGSQEGSLSTCIEIAKKALRNA